MTAWIENPFDNLPAEGFRPQRYWLMAEAFARAGHRAVLWTSDFSHAEKRRRRFVSPLADAPFEVRLVPTRPYSGNVSLGRVASHMAYARAWRDLALAAPGPAPDVIVASMPPLSTGKVALELARRFGAKLVADMQDAWPETFLRLAPRSLRPVAKAALAPLSLSARRLLRGADLVTGVCDRYRDMALGAGAKDYRRAYLGMRLPPRPPARRPGQPLRIVYAGGIGRTYDLATVLDALALLEGATLDIAGKGECEAALRARCAGLGLGERVRFHGYLDMAALSVLFAECTVGVVPMADDSFVGIPNKMADYAAAGLAVASSLGGESAALLARFGAGVTYAPGDAAGLARALRSLGPDAGANARRMAEAEFDADAIYDGYVRLVTAL